MPGLIIQYAMVTCFTWDTCYIDIIGSNFPTNCGLKFPRAGWSEAADVVCEENQIHGNLKMETVNHLLGKSLFWNYRRRPTVPIQFKIYDEDI
eukprot:Pgem_evm1s15507